MGNTKSTSCSNSTSITEQDLKLTDYDMTIYEYRKERIFKGTIAICIVYAFIALSIILSSYLFPNIKFVIFEKFLPFTIVFIIGTILLIIYLFYNILNFKPIKINKNYDYGNISCPDYWKLEYNQELSKYFDSNTINTNIFNYRCVLDPNIFSKTDLYFNRKNQLGVADGSTNVATNATTAIGITETATANSSDRVYNYNNYNKDQIDTDDKKYYYANIKDNSNYNIINKIAGTTDSNIYKNLVESSLLMNNYFFNSNLSKNSDYNIYQTIDLANKDNNFDTNIVGSAFTSNIRSDLKLEHVKFNNNNSNDITNTATSSIIIKKNITDGTSYLENIDYSSSDPQTGTTTKAELTNFPLVCNRVYPLLLAAKDKELSKNSSGKYDENILRCAYSKMCGIPWSDMNCDKYQT
jgi:hypothetical protein